MLTHEIKSKYPVPDYMINSSEYYRYLGNWTTKFWKCKCNFNDCDVYICVRDDRQKSDPSYRFGAICIRASHLVFNYIPRTNVLNKHYPQYMLYAFYQAYGSVAFLSIFRFREGNVKLGTATVRELFGNSKLPPGISLSQFSEHIGQMYHSNFKATKESPIPFLLTNRNLLIKVTTC